MNQNAWWNNKKKISHHVFALLEVYHFVCACVHLFVPLLICIYSVVCVCMYVCMYVSKIDKFWCKLWLALSDLLMTSVASAKTEISSTSLGTDAWHSLNCVQILISCDVSNLFSIHFLCSKNVPKKPSFLKRDLDARAHSEAYRLLFRLPATEKLDGSTSATLWTPYNKRHVWGLMFLSQNYLCFESRVINIAL